MTEFVVKIDERMYHTLTIEAETADEAVEKGYELLRNGMTKEEEVETDYSFESDGFTGEHSAELA
jgi:hypothetical protein